MHSGALLLLCSLFVTGPAIAVVKAYRGDPIGFASRSPQLTPSVVFDEDYFGEFFLEDAGSGSVTLDSLVFGADTTHTVEFTASECGENGANDYIFRIRRRVRVAPGQIGSGSAHPGGQVDWGVLSGWSQSIDFHCSRGYEQTEFSVLAPCDVCFGPGGPFHFGVPLVEDTSVVDPRAPLSSTYDLGTWSFDAQGDFEATPLLLTAGGPGGANTAVYARGQFFGSSLPALPAIGIGGLAGLLVIWGKRFLAHSRAPAGDG